MLTCHTHSRRQCCLVFNVILVMMMCSCVASSPKRKSGDPANANNTATDTSDSNGVKKESSPKTMPDISPLPFGLQRADKGSPLSDEELRTATKQYVELLRRTRYFTFLSERIHGWPASDPKQAYWYAHWWEYVFVVKKGGQVTFQHTQQGSDNVGIPTAAMLEGACYAQNLWGSDITDKLTRQFVRSFSAWIKATRLKPDDNKGPILARSFYPSPQTVSEGDRHYQIDTSLVRPGQDNGATEFVHVPNNPDWGDIWVKNKRSKDDIGHMLRALAHLSDCDASVSEDTRRDVKEALDLYGQWARKVEGDGFVLASLNKQGQEYKPLDTLARYITISDVECDGRLAIRLLGQGKPGDLDCRDGISVLGGIAAMNDQNRRILESHHEAATAFARQLNLNAALPLAQGLGKRLTRSMDNLEQGSSDAGFKAVNFAALMINAANVGVPLTSREIRWLHGQVAKATATYGALAPMFEDVFKSSTPDGQWTFTPYGDGLEFRDIGLLLGSCASRFRHPAARPLLDCQWLKQELQDLTRTQ